MIYKILADSVIIIHLLWIVFLITGAWWGRRCRAVGIVHISALVFAFVIGIFGLYCPLTYLENWLRSKYSPAGSYAGSFIAHYAEKIIYINAPPLVLFLLTAILCGFNAWVYFRKAGKKP